MVEFVVFSEQVAQGLIDRGFRLVEFKNGVWEFEDSLLLEQAVEEILEKLLQNLLTS
jgi:hypothetical protein